jgi:uncharacterized protein (DUF305 family)
MTRLHLRPIATFLFAVLAIAWVPRSVLAQASTSPVEQAHKDSLRRPYTAADIDFMSGMISHHAQAVAMAKEAESHGASKSVQIYCGRVAMAQTAEIGLMQTWLRDRKQPVPEADPKGMKMVMGGQTMMMAMPGMLTDEQMAMLDKARGPSWDRLFLTFMIQHHQGAITMVDKLFSTNGAGQDETVFKFANDVQADQSTEIDRMKLMLEAMASGN